MRVRYSRVSRFDRADASSAIDDGRTGDGRCDRKEERGLARSGIVGSAFCPDVVPERASVDGRRGVANDKINAT